MGRLTGESFTGSGGLSGAYATTYDGRGQAIAEGITVNGTNYPVQASYNDAGQLTSTTYPTGEVVTHGYDANGWLLNLSTQSGSTVTTLASNLAYGGLAGAAGRITTMDFGSGDIYNASYDTGLRLTSASLTKASDGTLLYQTQPAYDAANNVVNVQTSIGGATDTQQFCSDSLNRLTWAGATGTPPCASLTPGTLTAAQYQQSDAYNVDGGLTSGANGTYTYGDSSHPHALTSTSSGYSAAYDAAGNMTCRSQTSATTCSGTQTGQQLSYDAEGRLSTWESQPVSPAQTASYLYDGAGNRVAMQTTVNGTSTLTAYIGSIEEVQTTGSTTTTTTYYSVQGKRIAANVNGTFSYFGYDALGSQVVVLNNSGVLVGSQLYGPYGSSRYSNGTLPTSIGFTGQQSDSVTGLDYYVARYYDPAVGQFLSADTIQGNLLGMDPYAYVSGNPETFIDPTGHTQFGSGGDEAVAGYAEYVPYEEEEGEEAQFSTRTEETSGSFAETSGSDFAGSTDTNAFQEGQSWNGELHENRWREEQQTDRNGEDNSSADNPTPAENHPTENNPPTDTHPADNNAPTDTHPTDNNAPTDDNRPTNEDNSSCGDGLSFASQTLVATASGEQEIGKLKVGEKAWAYNPQTNKMELEPIQKVWLNHDNDLVDVTLVATVKGSHGKVTQQKEVLHTNEKHPFLTKEKGFIPVSQLKPGMHVLQADGSYGVVARLTIVPGTQAMYNLTVAQDHTYAVGTEQWIVHNCNVTFSDKYAGHVFRNEDGHLSDDTSDNRQLLIDAASDNSNFVGVDKYGNSWYSQTTSGGQQIWVVVRDGVIRNGGINDVPRLWDPGTGFSSPTRPGGP